MKRIGIIGVGLLGSAVAARLLENKFVVKGYDTRTEQVNQLQSRGLIPAENVAEAAEEADAVFTILPSLESVEKTILGAGGLIETAAPKTTLIQMSTISPELTRRLASAAAAKGPGFLDAPMSGTSAMVASGDCTIFVAGDKLRSTRAVLSSMQLQRKPTMSATSAWRRSRSSRQICLSGSTRLLWQKRSSSG